MKKIIKFENKPCIVLEKWTGEYFSALASRFIKEEVYKLITKNKMLLVINSSDDTFQKLKGFKNIKEYIQRVIFGYQGRNYKRII